MKTKNIRTTQKIEYTSKKIHDLGLVAVYENTDFLTVKLSKTHPSVLTLDGLVPNSDVMRLDFGNFRVQYFGLVAWNQLKVLHILDALWNVVAFIHILQNTGKKNKNFSTDIEFVGLFWTAYSGFFSDFCEWLWIDQTKSGIVTRFDYCVDIAGIHSSQLLTEAYERRKRRKSHFVGDLETYRNIDNERHSLVVYDKRLDVLDKWKHKIALSDGFRPYLWYLKADCPITRVEFRKKARALREMVDSSISSLALYGKQQFADHFGKNFRFDIQTFFEEQSDFSRHSLPSAPDPVTTGSIETKSKLYLDRFFTYAENYALLQSESALFDRFLSVYGERLTRRFFEWHSRNEVDKAFEKAASLLIVK